MDPTEQVAARLRQTGELYELDGEPIRRIVGRPQAKRNPFDLLWELRESARRLLGGELPEDPLSNVPVRRIVGKTRPL